jgi:mono/diheme cytochrome c family protein
MREAARTVVASTALLVATGAMAQEGNPAVSGAALYVRNECASCHVSGEARPLADLSQRYTVESLVDILRKGPPGMPGFDLSDSERRRLAEYLLATFP